MSYDLLVWEGPRPSDDAAAAESYQQLVTTLEQGELAPASPAIAEFVAELLRRWPDITTEAGEDSPWADGPLIDNASGPMIYFSMVWSMAEQASAFAAQLADRLQLVCFDPQLEQLRSA